MTGHVALAALVAVTSTTLPARAAETQGSQPWRTVARSVRRQLQEDPALASRHLVVDASGLVLTVSGTVADEKERRRVLEIARANAHMIVSDGLTLLSTPPVPPLESRAAQYRFVRTASAPSPAPRPPPPAPRPPPPAPRPLPPPARR